MSFGDVFRDSLGRSLVGLGLGSRLRVLGSCVRGFQPIDQVSLQSGHLGCLDSCADGVTSRTQIALVPIRSDEKILAVG